jgi:hypothetical protein
MDVHDRAATVELVHDRRERGVAEPLVAVAREERDAVGVERAQRVIDLAQGIVDVRKRQAREQPEARAMVRHHARPELVAFARDGEEPLARNERQARRGDRGERGADACDIHVLERRLGRPVTRHAAREVMRMEHELRHERRRKQMMMHVDAVAGHRPFIPRNP